VCDHIVKGKKVRSILVIDGRYIWVILLDKNSDKETKKIRPFVYREVVRIEIGRITTMIMSTMADGFMTFNVTGQPDEMIENGKKTEIIATLIKLKPDIQIQFSDLVMLKDKKMKATKYQWVQHPTAIEGGLYKSKKISVPPGAGRDAFPNLVEPPKPVHEKSSYSRPTAGGGGGGGGGGGAARPGPPPGMGGGAKKFTPAPAAARAPPAAPAASNDDDDWGDGDDGGYVPPSQPKFPMGGGPKKMMAPGPGGPKKMGGPSPAPGGPKKMGGPGPAPGGPKKMAPGPGGPKKMAPAPAAGGGRPAPPGF
jgi:hypothetical protein